MIYPIELQVICRLLTTENQKEIETLISFDASYYSAYKDQINYILDHYEKFRTIPDVFTFQARFEDIPIVTVREPLDYLVTGIKENKQRILLIDTMNKLNDMGSADIGLAWKYLSSQCDKSAELNTSDPMNIIQDAQIRADQVVEFSKQARIPTGFAEIDKLMYGGMSTVEELLLIIARTNSGKSWLCTRMMEAAQNAGFPVLFYSPEMQASYLSTRFDTWRGHFKNSQLFQGKYDDEYLKYISELPKEGGVSAYILEDKDADSGEVSAHTLDTLVAKLGIKLLIIDGLSYMVDTKKSDTDYTKYKNICNDLFKLSKKRGCAVVITMQANRATKSDAVDDKGEPMPTLYNVEGSDHPGRICTQAFSLRQIFDKHVLDIRLEKSRNANNQKPTFSYAWDVNVGTCRYIPSGEDLSGDMNLPTVSITSNAPTNDEINLEDDEVEF